MPENSDLLLTALWSVLLAFCIWLITRSYKKHCDETALLKKIEILLAHNLGNLLINQSYFESWISAMKEPRFYNCSFRTYFFLKDEDLMVSNQKLLNKLIKFDFSIRGFQADLNLLFNGYQETSRMLLQENLTGEWSNLNKNMIEQSNDYKTSFKQATEDAMYLVGFIRAYSEQKIRTPYGLFRMTVGRNLLPDIPEEKILKHKEEIEKEMKDKEIELDTEPTI